MQNMRIVIILYMLTTFIGAVVAVCGSFLFPITLRLGKAATSEAAPPTGVLEVLKNLLMNIVSNPVDSLVKANYISILAWAVVFGLALKAATPGTKKLFMISLLQLQKLYTGSSTVLHLVFLDLYITLYLQTD